jgi:hypothetical protein
MVKFLKKNYKKIIIICLIFLILSKKVSENFTTTQALDAVKSTEKKVNDVYYSIDKDWVRTKKGIYSTKEIKSDGNIRGPKINIGNNGTIYADRLNLNHNIEKVGSINSSGDVKGKRLCIGGTCIDENHLKVLTGGKYFSIVSGRSGKRLKDDNENGKFDNHNDQSYEAVKIHAIRNK